ncbi:nudix hydrolase 20, chloroplastic isoform X1 [Vitis vinifera]|uniref:nudix hydrolase 20, chloroplastic isoform X1 n=1 Tax=Vitis vinifera TaxID=29760 RepID=UPI0005401771|nr:nudix hydrolase 20, chloroplastic isoform X1 [Vitis vinifera]XP_010656361.1 nudix hydrolase 20, chloroplastic isoform X1 [Vitis vinifera]|eukprot:XP_010656360.1 PREDICTED: nudix hydrolase 20, chloroplastic isoform X1 [Vitis vinifera]
MACNHHQLRLCHSVRSSIASLSSPLLPTRLTLSSRTLASTPIRVGSPSVSATCFTWDDVVRISDSQYSSRHSSDLQGFFEKIRVCNRGLEKQSDFLPFVIEDQTVGYIHKGFFDDHLKRFSNVFIFTQDNSHIMLHPVLRTPNERTRAVGDVVKCLGEELIPGIRKELYPVASSFGAPVFFLLERAAAPYFGIKSYGVHMNGYTERNGQKYLWIGKRSQVKPTYPGMLDHLVAGGLPHGIACKENVMKECEEEAGIPRSMSKETCLTHRAVPVGAVSYGDIDGYRYKRDVLFCYDLKLPDDFIPKNQDGEVESFRLIPVSQVADVVRRTHFFKANCSLVIIDFLFRHGYIGPDSLGYLELLQSLRRGDCL